MAIVPLKIDSRSVEPHKAIGDPQFGARTVLTNSPWSFVRLWLTREGEPKAQYYWEQAQEFYNASIGLRSRSAPLLLYYTYMNATKALLFAKGISFNEHHGVGAHPRVVQGQKRSFPTEGVRIREQGILPSLSEYYGETETAQTHSLQDLFFNMVFIHRTYCLTYSSQKEMFLPLAKCLYMADRGTKQVFLKAEIAKDIPLSKALRRLPATFVHAPEIGERCIKSVASMTWQRPGQPTAANIRDLVVFNGSIRTELHYINGASTLWYLRTPVKGPRILGRRLPTLILAAMHRLSEICRYHPLQLESFLTGQKNWLLDEFIRMSAAQFIDEIASEITGYQFLIPNVRSAS